MREPYGYRILEKHLEAHNEQQRKRLGPVVDSDRKIRAVLLVCVARHFRLHFPHDRI